MKLFKTIRLFNNKGSVKVSVQDHEALSRYSWSLQNGRYAVTSLNKGKHRVYMHRMVLNVKDPRVQVDHINGDGLDNRRDNLRLASNKQNQWNRKVTLAKSGFRGVSYFPKNKSNPWASTLKCNGKTYHLGYYASAEAAAWVRDEKAKELCGEFASLNRVSKPKILRNIPSLVHRVKRKGSTSKYFGVSYRADQKLKWAASLNVNNRPFLLGSYATEEEAAEVYNKNSLKMFGSKAKLNII